MFGRFFPMSVPSLYGTCQCYRRVGIQCTFTVSGTAWLKPPLLAVTVNV